MVVRGLVFGASMVVSYLLPDRGDDDDVPRFFRGYYALGWFINWLCLLPALATAIGYVALGQGVGRLIGLAIALPMAAWVGLRLRKWQRGRRADARP